MSSHPALDAVRVGCVQYLNSKPLIYGWDGPVHFDHPSSLARDLARGALDVALVPVYELFARPGYRIVDGVSISSFGPVLSVFLAYQGELLDVKSVALDPASLTSSHLVRCLLAEYHGLTPDYNTSSCDPGAAKLLIGNQAIDFRNAHGAAYRYLDLGEEWTLRTGLPFVFALWLIRPGLPDAEAIAESLRSIQRDGVAHIAEIAQDQSGRDPEFCRRYLRDCIRFELGEAEKAGLRKFNELLFKHGFVSTPEIPCVFV